MCAVIRYLCTAADCGYSCWMKSSSHYAAVASSVVPVPLRRPIDSMFTSLLTMFLIALGNWGHVTFVFDNLYSPKIHNR